MKTPSHKPHKHPLKPPIRTHTPVLGHASFGIGSHLQFRSTAARACATLNEQQFVLYVAVCIFVFLFFYSIAVRTLLFWAVETIPLRKQIVIVQYAVECSAGGNGVIMKIENNMKVSKGGKTCVTLNPN